MASPTEVVANHHPPMMAAATSMPLTERHRRRLLRENVLPSSPALSPTTVTSKKTTVGGGAHSKGERAIALMTIMSKLINALKAKDSYGFFMVPVDTNIVTDYLTII